MCFVVNYIIGNCCQLVIDWVVFQDVFFDQIGCCYFQCDLGVGNGCCMCVVIGLDNIIIDCDLVFVQSLQINDSLQGMIDQVLDFLGVIVLFV